MRTQWTIWILMFCVLWAHGVRSQSHVIYVDSVQVTELVRPYSSEQIDKKIQQLQIDLWSQGFLFAQTLFRNDTSTFLHRGDKHNFHIDSLINKESGEAFTGWNQLNYKDIRGRVINQWINNGYPFASFSIQNWKVHRENFQADLLVDQGPFIVFDSLVLIHPVKTDEKHICQALEIQKGQPFNEDAFQKLQKRIGRLPYASFEASPDVSFSNGKSTIYLDISESATSSFEGVVGLLPNQSDGSMLVTGYLDLQLRNLFNSGKELSFTWNRFAENSQSLDLDYSHPFLLDTRLLLDVSFGLLRQDTSFVNQEWSLKLGSYLGTATTLKASYDRTTTNVLAENPEYVSSERIFDYEKDLYGLEFNVNNYDWPFDFYGGTKIKSSVAFGVKKLIRNPDLANNFYDSTGLKTTLGQLQFSIKNQRPVLKQLAVYHEVSSAVLINDFLLSNESYRLGGLRSIRGFNENFFFANQYAMSRLEVRQYFEKASYFMLFYDQLWYRNTDGQDWPFGLGLGFALSAKTSLFNFAIAVGKANGNPMNFSAAKIHFGYISRF